METSPSTVKEEQQQRQQQQQPDTSKSVPKPITKSSDTTQAAVAVAQQRKKKPFDGKAWAKRTKTALCKFWRSIRWILLVVVIFAALAAVSIYNSRRTKRLSPYHLERIRSLLQFASKSADEAERIAEDEPIQALLHANYAVTYFSAAKHLIDAKTIESLIGTNLDELEQYLKALQQRLLARVYVSAEQN